MLKGNRGEWSEVYVLLKLLAEGKLNAADENLNEIEDIYFPIIKIIREETASEISEFYPRERVEIYLNGEKVDSISRDVFSDEAEKLLLSIKNSKGKGAFEVKETEAFMNSINCYKISAPSSRKSDIDMQIMDINTGYSPEVGFSIKSQLGSAPTLLNASKSTNFIYRIDGFNVELAGEVNSINSKNSKKESPDLRGRMNYITENCGEINFFDTENDTFRNNLVLVDSVMDEIISYTLLYYYRDGITCCKDMVEKLQEENPMGYGNANAYSYKFKKFLTSVALGMKPATAWDGLDEASGGYIVVTKEGSVLAYHIYNRNYFEEYLLQNTKYDTPSTSRHGFGSVYLVEETPFLKLNLQVRFI